jgi:hypothetical protein
MASSKTTENPSADPQSPFGAAQNFFTHPQQIWGTWGRMAREQLDGAEAWSAELAKLGTQGRARMHEATDEMAKLVKSSIEHAVGLGETWRALGFAHTRRTLDLLGREG